MNDVPSVCVKSEKGRLQVRGDSVASSQWENQVKQAEVGAVLS